ncbi:ABC transporter permease [Hyperthermus butylicus]|uniref:ABC transmembrane type-2 domain-containing protein n=1 Tax=Hyperthermus butylicus (strain DSM 5456 / JCM 9403 / PLM1-5) TaxID=415426 RepID=A2BMQ1_HYPBU|nr:ABC transporter permease [Hyperthermus butylicus]ABM81262.1 hypothetical protein Hbut_1438 [Hyperthermus butylicus DSM 5456]
MPVSFLQLVRAEFYAYTRWLKNSRAMLATFLLWPYLMMLVMLGLGYLFGDPRIYALRMGVKNPVFFLLSASVIAMSTVAIIDDVAGYTLYNRWNGTLTYIALAPARLPKQLLAAGIPAAILSPAVMAAAAMPAAIVFEGLRGLGIVAAIYFLMLAGMIPLVGFSVLVASLLLIVKEESNVISSISPFLLLVSGVFYPVAVLPELLQEVSRVVPVRYVVEAARSLAALGTFEGRALMAALYMLAVLGVVYNAASAPIVARVEAWVKKSGFD